MKILVWNSQKGGSGKTSLCAHISVEAEHAGAAQAAPAELSSARKRLNDAENLQARDPDLARWRAQEAESDARLAEAIAQDAHSRVARL